MLIDIIADYLRSHKRLVIPQLGGFLVKDGGTVVFSELLRRDDGVLRGLLVEAGMNELAAAGEIDRFVFEVRHAIEQGESRTLAGLGIWRPGPQGTIAFEYRPETPAAGEAAAEPTVGPRPVPRPVRPAAPRVTPQPAAESPRPATAAPTPGQPERSEPAEADPATPQPAAEAAEPKREARDRYRPKPRRADALSPVSRPGTRKPDRFLLIGIAALVIALAAIAYGYYHDCQEQREADRMIELLEQATATASDAADAE